MTHPMAKGFEPEAEVGVGKMRDGDTDVLVIFRFRDDNSMINWTQVEWAGFLKHRWETIMLDAHDKDTKQLYEDYKYTRVLLGIQFLPFDQWYRQQPMTVQFRTMNGKPIQYRMTFDAWLTCERVLQRMIENPERYITEKEAILHAQEAPHTIVDEEVKQDFSIN